MNRYANPTGRYQRIEFGASVARVTTLRRGSFEAHTNSFVLDEIIDLAKAKIRDNFGPHLPVERIIQQKQGETRSEETDASLMSKRTRTLNEKPRQAKRCKRRCLDRSRVQSTDETVVQQLGLATEQPNSKSDNKT